MKERMKNLFSRMGRGGVIAAIAALCLSCVALADDSPVATASAQVTSSLTSGLTTVATDALSAISTILPYALGVVGAMLVVKLGIKAFKSIAGK